MSEPLLYLNEIPVFLIENDTDFAEAVAALAASDDIAFDLEYDDNRYTYGLTLCLIQAATRNQCFIIDPFGLENLQPLWDVIENPAITKIIHSASNDILLLKKLGCNPRNIFDSDLAAKMLGHERTSFANLMEALFEMAIDKTQQISNWNKRPLTEDQLFYAAADVVWLRKLKASLVAELQEKGRLSWMQEECRLLENLVARDQSDRYKRMKGAERFTYYQLFILHSLYNFRDKLAASFNKPAASVIPNDLLVRLVLHPIEDFETWQYTRGFFGKIKSHRYFSAYRNELEKAIEKAEDEHISDTTRPRNRRPEPTVSWQESEARKKTMQAILDNIRQTYGDNVASLILPQSMVKEVINGGNLQYHKQYAGAIIRQTAAALNLDLSGFSGD